MSGRIRIFCDRYMILVSQRQMVPTLVMSVSVCSIINFVVIIITTIIIVILSLYKTPIEYSCAIIFILLYKE